MCVCDARRHIFVVVVFFLVFVYISQQRAAVMAAYSALYMLLRESIEHSFRLSSTRFFCSIFIYGILKRYYTFCSNTEQQQRKLFE